jgi:hypothetical protein
MAFFSVQDSAFDLFLSSQSLSTRFLQFLRFLCAPAAISVLTDFADPVSNPDKKRPEPAINAALRPYRPAITAKLS